MIVVDASAMIEALVGRDADPELLDQLAGEVAAPHLLDVEVLSGLRGLVTGGSLALASAEQARADFAQLTVVRVATGPLADRMWELRHQYTAYDACYLSLAEGLGAPLVTCDRKLCAPGHRAEVLVYPRSR